MPNCLAGVPAEPRAGRLPKGATIYEAHQGGPPSREMSGGDDRRLDFRPGMGMWWEITRSTEDTSGELFEAANGPSPGCPVLPFTCTQRLRRAMG